MANPSWVESVLLRVIKALIAPTIEATVSKFKLFSISITPVVVAVVVSCMLWDEITTVNYSQLLATIHLLEYSDPHG